MDETLENRIFNERSTIRQKVVGVVKKAVKLPLYIALLGTMMFGYAGCSSNPPRSQHGDPTVRKIEDTRSGYRTTYSDGKENISVDIDDKELYIGDEKAVVEDVKSNKYWTDLHFIVLRNNNIQRGEMAIPSNELFIEERDDCMKHPHMSYELVCA